MTKDDSCLRFKSISRYMLVGMAWVVREYVVSDLGWVWALEGRHSLKSSLLLTSSLESTEAFPLVVDQEPC